MNAGCDGTEVCHRTKVLFYVYFTQYMFLYILLSYFPIMCIEINITTTLSRNLFISEGHSPDTMMWALSLSDYAQ